jgi:hypothetical protein
LYIVTFEIRRLKPQQQNTQIPTFVGITPQEARFLAKVAGFAPPEDAN